VLRPHGVIVLGEFDFYLYDRSHQIILVDLTEPLGPPWNARYAVYLNEAVRRAGGDIYAASYLHRWVSAHEALENVVYKEYWIPVVRGRDRSVCQEPFGPTLKVINSVSMISLPLC